MKLRAVITSIVLASALSTAGCASYLQEWKDNPVQAATDLATYTNSFLQIAETTWQALVPLLGAQQGPATAAFAKGTVDVQQALVAVQDAAQAYKATCIGQLANCSIDLMGAVKELQGAVAALTAIVAQYRHPAAVGDSRVIGTVAPGTLEGMSAHIAAWKH